MATPVSRTSTRTPTRPATRSGTGQILQTVFSVAFLLATLFTGFSPKMFSGNFGVIISGLLTPEPGSGVAIPTVLQAVRIGIVSGHWGNGGDPGAVCPDGTNEHDVNLAIATIVRQRLEALGYTIDLLQEFDPRLEGYQAALLLSIHSDTCAILDDQPSGFKLAASTYSSDKNLTDRLAACLYNNYSKATGLPYLSSSVTDDMTQYHAFRAINPSTPAAIIETGFLNLDRNLLVNHPDTVADGIVSGVLCFVRNDNVSPIPVPSP
jgi:N-acetylmuramoyl-L-alanine amidase